MLPKNKKYQVEITGYTSQGDGIAHIDGIATFIPGAINGEKCLIKIVKPMKNFAWAKLEAVLKPSVSELSHQADPYQQNHKKTELRIDPDCKYFKQCGGCTLRHMSYSEELEFKKAKVQDALNRIGHQDIIIDKIHACEKIDRYRNKAEFPVRQGSDGSVVIGMFRQRSHDVVKISDCLLQDKKVSIVVRELARWMGRYKIKPYNEKSGKGCVRHICIRTNTTGKVLVCLVVNQKKIENLNKLIGAIRKNLECFCGLVINYNMSKTNVIFGNKFKTIWGEDKITESICGLNFEISSAAFFQVNTLQAEKLYNRALELADIKPNQTAIDLYCGTGTITLLLAKKTLSAIGIEINKNAIENAVRNSSINDITNVKFICDDAANAAKELLEAETKSDLVCVDPPRKGLSTQAIETLQLISPQKIIYISCNPSTLARDVSILSGASKNNSNTQNGIFDKSYYNLTHVEAVDMFPRTPHIETIAILTKQ